MSVAAQSAFPLAFRREQRIMKFRVARRDNRGSVLLIRHRDAQGRHTQACGAPSLGKKRILPSLSPIYISRSPSVSMFTKVGLENSIPPAKAQFTPCPFTLASSPFLQIYLRLFKSSRQTTGHFFKKYFSGRTGMQTFMFAP
jgi:hypothetical protein